MAAVFCACFSRSAMRLRRRVMRTRSSRGAGFRAARPRGRRCGRRRPARRGAGGGLRGAARPRAPRLPRAPGYVEHVALGEAAVLAGGRDLLRHRACSPRPACARPGDSAFGGRHGRLRRLASAAGVGGWRPASAAAAARALRRAWRRGGGRWRRAVADHAEHGADLDGGAFVGADLGQRAGRRRDRPRASPCRSRARAAARRRATGCRRPASAISRRSLR